MIDNYLWKGKTERLEVSIIIFFWVINTKCAENNHVQLLSLKNISLFKGEDKCHNGRLKLPYVYMAVLATCLCSLCIHVPTCLCVACAFSTHRDQKRSSDLPELELQMAVNCSVGAGNCNLCPRREASAPKPWSISPTPFPYNWLLPKHCFLTVFRLNLRASCI